MRIFLTGGTGYIGGVVGRELIRQGHNVTGLFRGQDPDALPCGVVPVPGELFGPQRRHWVRMAATQHDAVIHCAWDPALPYAEFCAKEEELIFELLAEAASSSSSPSPLLRCIVATTSGSCLLGQGPEPDENAPTDKTEPWQQPRFAFERRFVAAGAAPDAKVRTCVVRPAWVYGGCGGDIRLFSEASVLAGKPPPVVAGGAQALPLVHVQDLARLYVMLATNPRCAGVFHGASGEHTTWRKFMEALSKAGGMGGRVSELEPAAGVAALGDLARLMQNDLHMVAMRPAKFGFRFEQPRLMPNFERFYREANSL